MNPLARFIFATLGEYSRIAPSQAGGYRLVRVARRALPRSQWKGRFTTPDDLKLDLDLGTYPDCCMAVGLYEIDTYRLLRARLKPGAWFVDCGANLGYFTLLASKWVGETGRVDAIEPDLLNRSRLTAHLAENAANNVTVHPFAASDAKGEIEFFHPTGATANHGMATLYRSLTPSAESYAVQTTRLDDLLAGLRDGVPDVIKIDVEGAELVAIEGMRKILQADCPPTLIVEHNHETSAAAGHLPSAIFEKLTDIQPRYRVAFVGRQPQPVTAAEELNQIHRQGNLLIDIP